MPKKSRFARNSKLPLSPVRRSLSWSPVFRDAGLCKTQKIIQKAKKIMEERICYGNNFSVESESQFPKAKVPAL